MTVFVLSIMSVSALATANVTIVTPAASGTMTGTAAWNCSLDSGFEAENWTSARVSLQSAALTN